MNAFKKLVINQVNANISEIKNQSDNEIVALVTQYRITCDKNNLNGTKEQKLIINDLKKRIEQILQARDKKLKMLESKINHINKIQRQTKT